MTQPKSRGPWILFIAALMLLVLLILPMTGWLARLQARMVVVQLAEMISLLGDLGIKELPGVNLNAPSARRQLQNVGSDYGSQLARALAYAPSDSGAPGGSVAAQEALLQRVRDLADRFPAHRTALLAHCLRYATSSLVRVGRDAEVESFMTGKSDPNIAPDKTSPPEALSAFDRDAQAGEHIDPDNAYFPLMWAVGLFAAHRDAQGLEAVQRAGNKMHFDDYSLDESEAMIQRIESTGGKMNVDVRKAIYTSALFPHYAQIRGAARFTAYKAAQAEVVGHVETGLAIRHGMMRCGALLRASRTWL